MLIYIAEAGEFIYLVLCSFLRERNIFSRCSHSRFQIFAGEEPQIRSTNQNTRLRCVKENDSWPISARIVIVYIRNTEVYSDIVVASWFPSS